MLEIGQGVSVLFVDDDLAVSAALGQALASRGYEVDYASDGNMALRKLAAGDFDVVVMDILMPDKEGIETIIELRKRWPDVFVVAVSGGGQAGPDDFLRLAQIVGADCSLAKPFRASRLIEVISAGRPPQRALRQSSGR